MSDSDSTLPLLYTKYADWWPLLSSPEEYAEEAKVYTQILLSHCSNKPRTLLELGSGGGHNAVHMKSTFNITMVDISNDMLNMSRKLNPECMHIQGDMRTVDLNTQFDAVFIHDAISHMVSKDDLRSSIETAYRHCRAGGAALFCPDHTRENFESTTGTGGTDSGNRGLRYLEWTLPRDSTRSSYSVYMIYLFRNNNEVFQGELDCLHCGLFSQTEWLAILSDVGFRPEMVPYPGNMVEAGNPNMFVGVK